LSLWISAGDVRTYANLDSTTGRYSDAAIGSNILAAQTFLEQKTGRLFTPQTGARKFTTENRAAISIPDVRSVTSVVLNGTSLTDGETYWLLPDRTFGGTGIYTGIQFRSFGRTRERWYLAVPDWWDRGLDMSRQYEQASLPNDLVITSSQWGWDPAPGDVRHAAKVLAAWMTKRADALLGNAVQTPDGSVLDFSRFPPEVNAVIETYRAAEQVVGVY